jgi:hypothetical protein
MSEFVTFEGRIEPLVWGKATYTIIRLPTDVLAALGPTRRVEGEIAEHPVNLAPTRAPVIDGAFLWAGQSLLERLGIAPGDCVEVRLRPAPDDRVDLPDDVAASLRASGRIAVWDALSPGKRRGLLYKIDTAKTDATRQKRIKALLDELSA